MLGKLTWTRYGLILFAGLAGFACSQEAREPVEVGAAQVELRSDLALPETQGSSTVLLDENPGQSANSLPTTQRRALSGLEDYSRDRAYRDIQRYEFLSALLEEPEPQKSSDQDSNVHANSWTLAEKHWVRSGKGFGVGAERMVSPGTVHPNDASFYFPAVALKPYSNASEQLEPMAGPFKSRKPLIFHSGATGFAHELPDDATRFRHSPVIETGLELPPTPETQVSSKPNAQVTLVPAKNRLDLMNGNENLNRHRFYQRDAGPGLAGAE